MEGPLTLIGFLVIGSILAALEGVRRAKQDIKRYESNRYM